MKIAPLILTAAIFTSSTLFAQTTAPATAPAGDQFVQQATTIVKAMRFADAKKTERVTELTAHYLRGVRKALDERKAALEKLGQASENTPEVDKQSQEAWRVCREMTIVLRDEYVAFLNNMMTPYQVERIKDGITDDWFHRTLESYDEMIPNLTHAQRAHIVGLLTEMRENAMLEQGVGPQEQWVKKYRGIINNYISRQGHDFTGLAKEYDAKKDAEKRVAKPSTQPAK